MKLSKALKEKNKIVKKIMDLKSKAIRSNSGLVGNAHNYDIKELLADLDKETEKLINIKTKIQLANAPILELIYKLSELKDRVIFYRGIPSQEGKVLDRGYGATSAIDYACVLNAKEIDAIVTKLEEDIEKIQEEIETFNHTTSIKI